MSLRRACVSVGLVGVLALAGACGDPEEATSPQDPAGAAAGPSAGAEGSGGPDGTAAPSGGSATAAPALDPAYAEAAPGPREGAIVPADILVFDPDPLSDEQVAAIGKAPGVTDVVQLQMAQVVVEDKVLNVVGVDAATYRRFTPYSTAETQAVWDRVAGGEVAIRPGLKASLPIDESGFVRLGNDDEAPTLHVGAFAKQIPGVDAVVNDKWAEALQMKPGNAVVVSTLTSDPAASREPIEEIAGSQASVQMLDVVSRLGLDRDAVQTAFLVGSVADVVGTFNYTVLGGGRIAPDPAWVASHIATGDVPILGSVTCNKAIFPQLRAALTEIVQRGLADKIHPSEYAGCYYPRFIAGSTSLSNHSFGTALDLNVPGNQRGTVGEMDRGVVDVFKKWGFAWGGDWNFTDPMHFEMSQVVNPG